MNSHSLEDEESNQQLLRKVIEQRYQELLTGIQVYIWKFGFVKERTQAETLVKEILQDTIVIALEKSHNYDINRPALPWLLGIALNVMRKRRRQQDYESQYITPITDTPQVRQRIQKLGFESISEAEMFEFLHHLPEPRDPYGRLILEELLYLVEDNEREVLRLAFVEGLKGKSLASALNIKEGTAWVRLHRAIVRLRQAYALKMPELEKGK
ncbi:sigma-70 family RNA polymerase sigma factor (plasmid) [Nostoc sp. C057]|uniref:RNA polymerase sigma factor n=1 Tax=Nostoc sp. C057 TaxID=2576903 RepID=UPI0015C3098D|nr:sigma-70 family RNA polymerase sigma factor [Nostoc sp. C057]QLE53615.1 sigma-70 family RNA polymerase sigma factor [Nostoc sp. C057]